MDIPTGDLEDMNLIGAVECCEAIVMAAKELAEKAGK